jgi:hypothetical protein
LTPDEETQLKIRGLIDKALKEKAMKKDMIEMYNKLKRHLHDPEKYI